MGNDNVQILRSSGNYSSSGNTLNLSLNFEDPEDSLDTLQDGLSAPIL